MQNLRSFLNPHNLARPALRRSEADFLSRFRWSLQIFDISHENSVFVVAKEKVGSVATGECASIVPSGSGRCQINIVPAEPTVLKMRDHFCQRLNALCVRDFVHEPLHHRHISVSRQDAGLDQAFFADYFEMKFES